MRYLLALALLMPMAASAQNISSGGWTSPAPTFGPKWFCEQADGLWRTSDKQCNLPSPEPKPSITIAPSGSLTLKSIDGVHDCKIDATFHPTNCAVDGSRVTILLGP